MLEYFKSISYFILLKQIIIILPNLLVIKYIHDEIITYLTTHITNCMSIFIALIIMRAIIDFNAKHQSIIEITLTYYICYKKAPDQSFDSFQHHNLTPFAKPTKNYRKQTTKKHSVTYAQHHNTIVITKTHCRCVLGVYFLALRVRMYTSTTLS